MRVNQQLDTSILYLRGNKLTNAQYYCRYILSCRVVVVFLTNAYECCMVPQIIGKQIPFMTKFQIIEIYILAIFIKLKQLTKYN